MTVWTSIGGYKENAESYDNMHNQLNSLASYMQTSNFFRLRTAKNCIVQYVQGK